MRKRLLILFICFVTIPIIIIYTVATYIFNSRAEMNLKDIYTNDIKNIAQIAEHYFSESLELTMYPLLEPNLYKFYTMSSDSDSFQQAVTNANTILLSSPYVFGGIRNVILQRNDGIQIVTRSNYIYDNSFSEYEIEQADLLNGGCFWEFQKINSIPLFSATRIIRSKSNLTEKLGYVHVTISTSELYNNIKSAVIDKNFSYFILDENNQVLLSTDKSNDYSAFLPEYHYGRLCSLSRQSVCTVLDGDYFISAQEIKGTPYVMCSIINPDVFIATKATLGNILTVVAILTVLSFVLLALLFSHSVVRPLKELGDNMLSISGENFSVRAAVKGKDEIAILAKQFNYMVEQLEYLYKQVYMGEIELKKSQIIALQSQMNPHFLYNTMDTIYWMAQMGNTQDISKMASNMSKLLRLSFAPNDNNTLNLAQELEHLSCYMEIQKIRYGDSVDFDLQYEEDLDDISVLRLLLQPLVENALTHGLKDQPHEKIIVQIYREDTFCIYKVMNNGTLINLNQIRSILESDTTKTKGFAIRNIDKRLKLKYGDAYGLKYNIENGFTIFEIRQPIL